VGRAIRALPPLVRRANLAAINAEQFGKRLDGLRADGLLRSRAKGEDVYCLDVKLVA